MLSHFCYEVLPEGNWTAQGSRSWRWTVIGVVGPDGELPVGRSHEIGVVLRHPHIVNRRDLARIRLFLQRQALALQRVQPIPDIEIRGRPRKVAAPGPAQRDAGRSWAPRRSGSRPRRRRKSWPVRCPCGLRDALPAAHAAAVA